jgi:hypothetical protein
MIEEESERVERRGDVLLARLIEDAIALQQTEGDDAATAFLDGRGVQEHTSLRVLSCAAFRRKHAAKNDFDIIRYKDFVVSIHCDEVDDQPPPLYRAIALVIAASSQAGSGGNLAQSLLRGLISTDEAYTSPDEARRAILVETKRIIDAHASSDDGTITSSAIRAQPELYPHALRRSSTRPVLAERRTKERRTDRKTSQTLIRALAMQRAFGHETAMKLLVAAGIAEATATDMLSIGRERRNVRTRR